MDDHSAPGTHDGTASTQHLRAVDAPRRGAVLDVLVDRLNTPSVWIVAFFAGIVALGALNMTGPSTAGAAGPTMSVSSGSLWRLDRGGDREVPVCRTARYLDGAANAIRSGDAAALGVMSLGGKVTLAASGTPVKVLGGDGSRVHVRITGGEHTGVSGYVRARWLGLP